MLEERAEFERKAVEDGLAGYRIRSVASDGTMSVAPDASEYFPILYNSKIGASASIYGLDLLDGGMRQQALGLAAKQARAHADAIAAGLGARTGAVVSAQEGGGVSPVVIAGTVAAAPTPIQTGQVSVTASVTITVQLTQ